MLDLLTTLTDIRSKLSARVYRGREQIQFGVVMRLLQDLEWNIWDPEEVLLNFVSPLSSGLPIADIALLLDGHPVVLIKIEAMGATTDRLSELEPELHLRFERVKSQFAVVTDGSTWNLHLLATDGPSVQSRFRTFDIREDKLELIQSVLWSFLSRSSLSSGESARKARGSLREAQLYANIESLTQEAYKEAESRVSSLAPETLIQVAEKKGFTITKGEALRFLAEREKGLRKTMSGSRNVTHNQTEDPASSVRDSVQNSASLHKLHPNEIVDLSLTALESGQIGTAHARRWNDLLHAAIREALKRKLPLRELDRITTAELRQHSANREHFREVKGTNVFVETLDATKCYLDIFSITRALDLEMKIHFRWLNRKEAAYPGEKGVIHWSPRN